MAVNAPDTALRYRLAPNPEASAALEETFARYERMMDMLDTIAAEKRIGANLVALHGYAYEPVRKETGLPSRLVTLGLRDRAAYRASSMRRLPLDERLVNVKTAALVSVSTVRGRFEIPFHVLGYVKGWGHSVPAYLVRNEGAFEIHFGVAPNIQQEDVMVAQSAPAESLFSRAGRLLAGIAVEAIERAEGKNKRAVVKQAIREIEAAETDARDSLAHERAQEWRLKARQAEIANEMDKLNAQIATAVSESRDDLAKAGIARQMDLEAQFEVVGKALEENEEKIETALTALRAITSGLQDAETRLAELKQSEEREMPKAVAGGRAPGHPTAAAKSQRASRAIARTVGVPASMTPSKDIDELSKLHRDKEIAERLAKLKSDNKGTA